jgi:hypothetical protein
MYENSVEIYLNCYFFHCNGMWRMFKPENIIVTNGTTHCKLKQGSEIVFFFNLNTLIGFAKVSYTFMRNEKLHLLNLRRENSFKRLSTCMLYHFNHTIVYSSRNYNKNVYWNILTSI